MGNHCHPTITGPGNQVLYVSAKNQSDLIYFNTKQTLEGNLP
jgi:hypothetical protein